MLANVRKGKAMALDDTLKIADDYLDAHWEDMVADINMLVRIPSFKEEALAGPDAPWGPGPRAALTAGLDLAESMGFRKHDLNGYVGWADLHGADITQVGIIGHMDVVPAGPGWHFEPYQVTRKDGFLLGRGVFDDKGPSVVALHAVNALHQAWGTLPYTVRFIFGADEECGMGDIPYYRAAQPDPAFVFTPDASFPVCYGEKGHYDATVVSAPLDGGCIVAFEGGQAPNAVPGQATCIIRADEGDIPGTDRITVTPKGCGLVELFAQGKSAHASTPAGGINAIGLLVDHLLEHAPLSPIERDFLQLEQKILGATDGSGVGLAASDDDFGSLTLVGGVITFEDGRLNQTVDCRYPTNVMAEQITDKLTACAVANGALVYDAHAQGPFVVDASRPEIQALLDAYVEVTGQEAKPFTMGGGTYAREFRNAASYGPGFPGFTKPDWVGSMHGPDEGVSEETLRQAFRIYVVALAKLMQLSL